MFTAFFQNVAQELQVRHLLADPTIPERRMQGSALMLERGGKAILLPESGAALKPGDRILFVGSAMTRRLQRRYLTEPGTVSSVLTGHEPARGLFFRWWEQRTRKDA
jgi:hypothetical protein